MSQLIRLKIASKDRVEPEIWNIEIPDSEWMILCDFAKYANQLENSSFMKGDGIGVHLVLRGDMIRKELSHESIIPPEDTVAALLHRMRPFVLTDERTEFGHVVNILKRYLPDKHIRDHLKLQQRQFTGKDFQQQVSIQVNGKVVNSEEFLRKWLNAHEYHRDLDKQQELKPLEEWFPDDYSRGLFICMMIDKARAVINVGRFVRWIESRTATPFNMGRPE